MTPELAEALATVTSFPELLAAIHRAKYTGRLVLDCYCGVPQQVEIPQAPPAPVRVAFGNPRKGATDRRTPPAAPAHSSGD